MRMFKKILLFEEVKEIYNVNFSKDSKKASDKICNSCYQRIKRKDQTLIIHNYAKEKRARPGPPKQKEILKMYIATGMIIFIQPNDIVKGKNNHAYFVTGENKELYDNREKCRKWVRKHLGPN